MPQIQVIEPLARPQVQKLRVAAYCRVSSDSDDQRNSFSTQVQHYTQLIQSHPDWEFVDIYADEGITGTRADKRDDFQRLMADCRAGKIDQVLVKSLSRFARNSKDCIQAVRELQSLGISVFFEKEHLDTGKLHNEMTLSMMSAFAQEESISISQNMRRGALMRMKNGTFRISQIPYGYRRKESGELIPIPEEAEVVRWIYHSFLSGKGIASIAKDLESRKVPKLRGEPVWSKHGVLYILTNERYTGNELFRKSYRTDAIPFRKVDNRGEKSQFYAEATHEAIVPFQTFQQVQKLLQKRKEQFGKQQQGPFYPLSGKITCGLCGGTYYRRLTSQGTSWVCENHLASRCPAKGMGEKEILSTIQRFLHRLGEHRDSILSPYLEQLETLWQRERFLPPSVLQLQQSIAALLSQSHTLAQLRAQECVDSDFFISQNNQLQKELENLRQQLKREQGQTNLVEKLQSTRFLLNTLGSPLPDEFSPTLFQSVITGITAQPEGMVFHLVNGLSFAEPIGGFHHG